LPPKSLANSTETEVAAYSRCSSIILVGQRCGDRPVGFLSYRDRCRRSIFFERTIRPRSPNAAWICASGGACLFTCAVEPFTAEAKTDRELAAQGVEALAVVWNIPESGALSAACKRGQRRQEQGGESLRLRFSWIEWTHGSRAAIRCHSSIGGLILFLSLADFRDLSAEVSGATSVALHWRSSLSLASVFFWNSGSDSKISDLPRVVLHVV